MEAPPSTHTLAGMVNHLTTLDTTGITDAELVDRIGMLEILKSTAAAAQARASVALRELREDQERAAGRPTTKTAAAVAAEIALARRESPHRARTLLGLATILDRELPHTMAAFTAGAISEWRALLVCRETACLTRDDRAQVDARLAGELGRLSDREIVARARHIGYQLDPHSVTDRANRAATDRRVTIRPAPDTMTFISALLPVAQGVALYAALRSAADQARAAGDPRSRGQVMADTLVCRTTGQQHPEHVGVEIQLVISDQTLLAAGNDPARIPGHGPIPAGIARHLAWRATTTDRAWIRRLYTRPTDGQLIAMDSHRRHFPHGLAQAITVRDDHCRTPWCGAPIRHIDHVIPARNGGPTSAANGQGLCEQCNQTKEHPGWQARPGTDGTVSTVTPSGHRHDSPPRPVLPNPPAQPSRVDLFRFEVLIPPRPTLTPTRTG